jgi:hypothetical protein
MEAAFGVCAGCKNEFCIVIRAGLKNAGNFKEKFQNVITRKVINRGRGNLIFRTLETLE